MVSVFQSPSPSGVPHPPRQGAVFRPVPGESGREAGRPPPKRPIQRAAGELVRGKNPGIVGLPRAVAGGLPSQCLQTWPRLAPRLQFASFPFLFPLFPPPLFKLLRFSTTASLQAQVPLSSKGQAAGLTSHTLIPVSPESAGLHGSPGAKRTGRPMESQAARSTLIPLSWMGPSAPHQALHFIPTQGSPLDFPTVHPTPVAACLDTAGFPPGHSGHLRQISPQSTSPGW